MRLAAAVTAAAAFGVAGGRGDDTTRQTIGAQVAASAFVIGSFFLAKELQVNRPRRRALAADATPPTPLPAPAPPRSAPRAPSHR